MKKIAMAIVGNGAAGYFTAAAIKRNFPEIDVTIYYDPTKGHIGVGESIGFHSRSFFRDILGLGENDSEWISASDSGYKLGVKCVGWDGTDTPAYYGSRLFDYFNEWYGKSSDINTFGDMWLQLYKRGLRTADDLFYDMPLGIFDKDSILTGPDTSYTYHINANNIRHVVHNLVGKPAGVKEVAIPVKGVVKSSHDTIGHLILENNETVTADLYVDCSGFQKVLVNELPFEFVPAGPDYNNTAIVGMYDYQTESEKINWTTHCAMDQGWRFEVSLPNRSGNGYIFNSQFVKNEQDIVDEFEHATGRKNVLCKKISWEPGYQRNAFVGNCIVLGLGFGMIDGFDANVFTGTLKSLTKIVEFLKQDSNKTFNWKHQFNTFVSDTTADVYLRIDSAFHLAPKNNTPYWQFMKTLAKKYNTLDRATAAIFDQGRKNGGIIYHNPQLSYIQTLISYYKLDVSIPEIYVDPQFVDRNMKQILSMNSQHRSADLTDVDRLINNF